MTLDARGGVLVEWNRTRGRLVGRIGWLDRVALHTILRGEQPQVFCSVLQLKTMFAYVIFSVSISPEYPREELNGGGAREGA